MARCSNQAYKLARAARECQFLQFGSDWGLPQIKTPNDELSPDFQSLKNRIKAEMAPPRVNDFSDEYKGLRSYNVEKRQKTAARFRAERPKVINELADLRLKLKEYLLQPRSVMSVSEQARLPLVVPSANRKAIATNLGPDSSGWVQRGSNLVQSSDMSAHPAR